MKSSTAINSGCGDKDEIEDGVECEFVDMFDEEVESQQHYASHHRVLYYLPHVCPSLIGLVNRFELLLALPDLFV